jgi:hypothetical protein
MIKKCLFIVPRVLHLKILAWFIFKESKRGNKIYITSKFFLLALEKYIPFEIRKDLIFISTDDAKKLRYDKVYNPTNYSDIFNIEDLIILKNNSKRMIAIDEHSKAYKFFFERKPLSKKFWDIIYVQKEFILDEYLNILPKISKKKLISSFAQLNFKFKDEKTLRKKYMIPEDKKIILFSPPQTTSQSPKFFQNQIKKILNFYFLNHRLDKFLKHTRKLLNLRFNYSDYKYIFRKIFPNNKWYFILKTRDKTKIENNDYCYYDLVVSDENFFPHTLNELIKISSLVVGYSSSITVDAITQNKLAIEIEQYKDFRIIGSTKLKKSFYEKVFVNNHFKNDKFFFIKTSENKDNIIKILNDLKLTLDTQ